MTSPPTNCPLCNSMQAFRPRERLIDETIVQRYIYCKMCRREFQLEVFPLSELQFRRRHRRRRNAAVRHRA